ncbi:MAG: hypothetical protein J5825_11130, partial [Lachnospiraceae bacterium]|nr:hypothetical protein [Lachnospiraceae bacterium]
DTVKNYFAGNPSGTYDVKVKIRIVYDRHRTFPDGLYDPNGDVFTGEFGHDSNSGQNLDLKGDVADFRQIEAVIHITNN